MEVRLTDAECRLAASVGVARRLDSLAAGRTEVYGSPTAGTTWDIDVEAAAGELAVAKALGRYWAPADDHAADRRDGDVDGLQVRHTRRPDGCLICHQRDHDDHRFVLVVGAAPFFRVVGSILGVDAKRPEHWRSDVPRPAFFVAQRFLTSVAS